MNSSLVLKSLQWDVRRSDLLKRFPEAFDAKVLTDEAGRSKGMGFVDFKDGTTATMAKQEMQGAKFLGRPVVIAYSLRIPRQFPDGVDEHNQDRGRASFNFDGGSRPGRDVVRNIRAPVADNHDGVPRRERDLVRNLPVPVADNLAASVPLRGGEQGRQAHSQYG